MLSFSIVVNTTPWSTPWKRSVHTVRAFQQAYLLRGFVDSHSNLGRRGDSWSCPFLQRSRGAGSPTSSNSESPAKRVTNATLAEQVAALSAPVALLSARQEAGPKETPKLPQASQASFATPVAEPGPLGATGYRSAGLQTPARITPAKALVLIGPPPRVRDLAIPDEPLDPLRAPKDPTQPAISSTDRFGDSSHSGERPLWPGGQFSRGYFEFQKRHSQKGNATTGPCRPTVAVLHDDSAAGVQEATSLQCPSEERRGAPSEGVVSLDLCGTRYGSSSIRRLSGHQGVFGFGRDGIIEQSVFDAGDWGLACVLIC